ncbi:MAG: D-alanyl-D-alanine carboxypeptidase [Defluviitaleaceae bacterium]|nr:D-alanyl-D-alanine carboxypeptidase [Defluviitaleaceae bacterium]
MKTLSLLLLAVLAAAAQPPYGEETAVPDPPYVEEAAVPDPPSYTAGGVVVMCADTGLVLYGNQEHTEFYPASITKVMTALVVLDHVQDLSERVTFSHNAVFSIPRNSSHISMDVGERLSVYESLHALLLRSANEVALALAEYVAGSVEEFTELMNHRAAAIGANDTRFVNPTGLPATGHVTTAYDMALIMREAVRLYPVFTEIISTRQFAIPPTERQAETRFVNTTNQLIRPGTPYFNPSVIGSKTGWTHAAGNTLLTYAEHEGRKLIVTILQGSGTDPFRETTSLLDYAFQLPYEERIVFNAESYTRTIPVYREADGETAEAYRLTLRAGDDLRYSLPLGFDLTMLRYDLNVPESVTAPVSEGDIIGSIAVYAQNVRLGSVNLLAQSTVGEAPLPVSAADAPTSGEPIEAAEPAHAVYPYAPANPSPAYGGFWDAFRDSDELSALVVPLTVAFLGLLVSIVAFATRRKRRMKQFLYIGSGGGKRYTSPYFNSYRYR